MSLKFDLSDELSGSPEKRAKWLKEAVGRNIVCEDGLTRYVHEIVFSMKWPWKCIINEKDPASKSGYYVSTLSLCAQLLNKPLPSLDQEVAFQNAMKIRFGIRDDGSYDKPPEKEGKIFLPPLLRN